MSQATFQGTASERVPAGRGPSRRIIALGAALALGVVAMVGLLGTRSDRPVVATAVAAPPTIAAPVASPPLTAAVAPPIAPASNGAETSVALTIDSTPPGATVKRGDEVLGRTPAKVTMSKSVAKVPLSIVLEGYEVARVEVAPSEDRTLLVPLQAARSPRRPPTTPKAASSTKVPAGSGTAAEIEANPFK